MPKTSSTRTAPKLDKLCVLFASQQTTASHTRAAKSLVSLLLIVLVIGLSNCQRPETPTPRPNIQSIILKDIEITRLPEVGRQGEAWDEDSGPDLFLEYASNVDPITPLSDTLYDYVNGEQQLTLLREIEINRETTRFTLRFWDHDFNPRLPDDFQSNDQVLNLTVFPWTEDRLNLVDADVLILESFPLRYEVKLTVERRE